MQLAPLCSQVTGGWVQLAMQQSAWSKTGGKAAQAALLAVAHQMQMKHRKDLKAAMHARQGNTTACRTCLPLQSGQASGPELSNSTAKEGK